MKCTWHKSCSCEQCKAGRSSDAGHTTKRNNEHKLRRMAKRALRDVVLGRTDDAFIYPISSPYTD